MPNLSFICPTVPYKAVANKRILSINESEKMKITGAAQDRQKGQALMEYTLLLMMVTMVFWVGIKNSDMSQELARAWSRVSDCVEVPAACDSAS